jgi:hypothetical protein
VVLDQDQSIALSNEIDATATLFRHGHAILDEYRFASRDAEAVFVCLAGGVEKLLKLTFGLLSLEESGIWPAQATMKHAGHRILELDEATRALISQHHRRSTVPGLIADLLERTASDPGLSQILATLERYATNGRFYNLDLLGGLEQKGDPPQELWEELQLLVVDANPELLEQLAAPDNQAARRTINRIIASSLGTWCELMHRSWITGVCGAEAQRWSSQLELGHASPHARGGSSSPTSA